MRATLLVQEVATPASSNPSRPGDTGCNGPAAPLHRPLRAAAEAERLLWRAGFGPRRGQAASLAGLGLDGAVQLAHAPPGRALDRPCPHDDKGRPLAPADAYGHDHLWWLDRMVRTRRPLVERMTLVWHDWFATSNAGVGSQKLMLAQNRLLRRYALGSFDRLLVSITANPAMLIWLSGTDNRKDAPNENYGRELMELFTLGEGNGYTERDVREQARALTGWTSTWKRGKGQTDFRFDPKRHDTGTKTVFGKQGAFSWRDSARSASTTPSTRRSSCASCGATSSPCHPMRAPRPALEADLPQGFEVRPVLEAILRHPALYKGPRMVKPPVVYIAGLLRGLNRGIDTSAWVWLSEGAGQRLFNPPNVAGLGRLPLARHERVPRPLVHREHRAREGVPRRPEGQEGPEGARTTPRRSSRARSRCSATRRFGPRPHASCWLSPAARCKARPAGRRSRIRRSSRTPSASSSPSPPTSRPADGAAATSTREPSSCGAASPRPAAACPRSSPACPMPAGTGLDRRTLRRPRCRPRARRLRRRGARGPRCSTRASRPPQRRARSRRCSSRCSSTAAPTRSRCSPRPATRSTASSGRGSRSPAGAGTVVRRGPEPHVAPLARPARPASRRGQGQRHARESATTTRTSRTSPRAISGRSAPPTSVSSTGWLGRYLDRVGSRDNPLQGLSLDWSLQPSLATAKMPVAAVDAPDRYDFWARGVWGEVVGPHGRHDRAARRAPDPRRPRSRGGKRRSSPVGAALRPADTVSAEGRPQVDRQPGRLSARRRRLPTPSRRPRGDARCRAAAARRGALRARRLRHA